MQRKSVYSKTVSSLKLTDIDVAVGIGIGIVFLGLVCLVTVLQANAFPDT